MPDPRRHSFPTPAVHALLLQERMGGRRAQGAAAGWVAYEGPPRIVLHEGTGQEASCLEGLVAYARQQAQDPRARQFPTLESYTDWSYARPVIYDLGEGPSVAGCDPLQRSRGFAEVETGGNCWEVSGLLAAAAIANEAPLELHIYDARVNGQRHIFPAVKNLGDAGQPEAVVLQPPVLAQGLRQAWGRGRAQLFYQEIAQGLTAERVERGVESCGRYLLIPDFGITFGRCMDAQRELEEALGPYMVEGISPATFLDLRVFDAGFYLGKYPDLQEAFGDNTDAATDHWLKYGMKEGRQGAAGFDVKQYLELYPDLRKVYGNDYPFAVRHFVDAGIREGRQGVKAQGLGRANGPDRGTLKNVSRGLESFGSSLLGILVGPQAAEQVRRGTEPLDDRIIDGVTDEPDEPPPEPDADADETPARESAVERYKAEEAAREAARRGEKDQPVRCECSGNQGASR